MADIPDQTLYVSAANIIRVDLQEITNHVNVESQTQKDEPKFDLLDIDISTEQEKDDKWMAIKKQLKQDDPSKSIININIILYI
jgi:hypothetical protein